MQDRPTDRSRAVQHLNRTYRNGTYRNSAMAVSDRRAVAIEYGLLRLLRPVL